MKQNAIYMKYKDQGPGPRETFAMNTNIRMVRKQRTTNQKIDNLLNQPIQINHADRIETSRNLRDRANLISRHMSAGSMVMANNQADAFVKLLYDKTGIVLSVMVAKILTDRIWLNLQVFGTDTNVKWANGEPFTEPQAKAMFPQGDNITEVLTFVNETAETYDKTMNLMHRSSNCISPQPNALWNVKTVTALNQEHQQFIDEQSLMTRLEIIEEWKTTFFKMVNRLFSDNVWQRIVDHETEQLQLLNNSTSADSQGDLDAL